MVICVKDFLHARNQQVIVNGVKSFIAMVLSGIPQGSILGHLLFVCFVNDMTDVVQAYIHMFTDDIKLYRAVNTPEDTEALQTDLTNWNNGQTSGS